MSRLSQRGLYAITPGRAASPEALVASVRAAIEGGAVALQYRDKSGDRQRRRAEAQALLALCRSEGVPLIVNDDPELAAAVDADGVHLGAGDPTTAEARGVVGPAAIIGVSCYDRLAAARQAVAEGADYVAFGSFFPSASKDQPRRPEPAVLGAAKAELGVPVVAIGGITPDNAGSLVAAGADLIAAIGGVFDAPDIGAAARRYSALFHEHSTRQQS